MDENIKKIPELFGCMVFNEDKMRQRCPPTLITHGGNA